MAGRTLLLVLGPVLLVFVAGCGRSSQAPVSDEPIFARGVVKEMRGSSDRTETILVRTDEGKELLLTLSGEIDQAAWSPEHLGGHLRLGELTGGTIGVKYVQKPDGPVAIELSE